MAESLTDDSKRKIETHKEKIQGLKERLKVAEDDLAKFEECRAKTPPPPEFSQAWAQEDRMLLRAIVSKEREAQELRREIAAMEQVLQGYLQRLAEEAQRQLEADMTWWQRRKVEHLQQTKAARDRDVRLKVNPILGDLRLIIGDEQTAIKVKEALETTSDPEIQALINEARSGELPHWQRTARQRLKEWELAKA